jgi:two-component system sensor histidine kinase BaeS
VIADGDRLHQIIGNLLANAAHYCRSGDRAVVHTRARAGWVRSRWPIPVRGSGPRSFPTCSTVRGGAPAPMAPVGRGWACRSSERSVLAEGGSVDVASTPGQGASLRVALPEVHPGHHGSALAPAPPRAGQRVFGAASRRRGRA